MAAGRESVMPLRLRYAAATFVLLALVLAPLAGGKNPPAPDKRCAVGHALRSAGQAEAARKEYVRLLRANPSTPCAVEGLGLLAAKPPGDCAYANALLQLGRLADAEAEFKKVIAIDPQLPCARTGGLVKINKLRCDIADKLADRGAEDEARKLYESALTGSPKSCASIGLASLSKSKWHEDVISVGEDAGKVLSASLLFGGLLVIGLVLLRRPVTRPVSRWHRVPEFCRRPRLRLEKFDNASGDSGADAGFTALVRSALLRLSRDSASASSFSFEGVSGTEGLAGAIATLGGGLDPLKTANAVVSALQHADPRSRYALTGTLLKQDGAYRVAQTLDERGRTVAAQMLAGQALSTPTQPSGSSPTTQAPPRYDALATATAAWARYHIVERETERPPNVHDAGSYGLMMAARDARLQGDAQSARLLLSVAIDLDPVNAQAWLELAIATALAGDPAQGVSYTLYAAALIEAESP